MTGKRQQFTAPMLRDRLDYNPDTGFCSWRERPLEQFTGQRAWRTWNTRYAGKRAGSVQNNGYRKIAIDGYPYTEHRIIWLLVHGVDADHIDHQDGDRANNKLANLRSVTAAENHKNVRRKNSNSSGVTGVTWSRRRSKWRAYIRVNYIRKDLGEFSLIDDAIACRKAAEKLHGFHQNHGRAA